MKLISALLLLSLPFHNLFSQESPAPPSPNIYHQIFLKEPVQKIIKLEYMDDSGPIEHRLSPDGKSIQMLDYKGEGGVRAEVIDDTGNVQEIQRSKCNIHSLQEL